MQLVLTPLLFSFPQTHQKSFYRRTADQTRLCSQWMKDKPQYQLEVIRLSYCSLIQTG